MVLLDGAARARPRSHAKHTATYRRSPRDVDTVLKPLRGHRRYNARIPARHLAEHHQPAHPGLAQQRPGHQTGLARLRVTRYEHGQDRNHLLDRDSFVNMVPVWV